MRNENNYLVRLQKWYQSNCNGDWEHSFGVNIDSLDNPGWRVEIDLEDTCLENGIINISEDKGEDDWYIIETKEKKFIGNGDFSKLNNILEIFFEEFLPRNKDDNFLYTLYVPISETFNKIFIPIYAIMVKENIFQIKKINSLSEEKKYIQFVNIEDISGINLDDVIIDIKFKVNDLVNCELKRFFNKIGLVIKNKVTS